MPSTPRSQRYRTALTEELKAFIAAEVEAQLKPVAETVGKIGSLLDRLGTQREQETAETNAELKQLLARMEEICRAFGIDPTEADLTPLH
jgi:hypothetical protein